MIKFGSSVLRHFLGAICCMVTLIFIILSIPVYIFRFVVILYAKCFRPDLGDILNGHSSYMVNEIFESNPLRSTIVACCTVKGDITIEEIYDRVTRGWINTVNPQTGRLVYERFQQYPIRWCGFAFYKKDDKFDIRNHVHCHESFGGPFVSEEDVGEFTESLLNGRFRPKTSLWEIHLVTNYQNPKVSSDEMCLVVLKLHHSLGDGLSFLSALSEGFMETPLTNVKLPMPKIPKLSVLQIITRLFTLPIAGLYEFSHGVGQGFRPSPWKVPNRKKEWYQFVAKSDPIPIATINEIRNAFGVTFSSVLFSAVSSAIYQQLEAKRRRGEEVKGDDGSMFCLSALPLPGRKEQLTNHVTATFLNIPTTKFSDPLERLRICYQELEDRRLSVVPLLTTFGFAVMGCRLGFVCKYFAKNRMASAGLTNFPSLPIVITDQQGRELLGADFVAGGFDGNMGMGIMILGYNKNVKIVFSAEKALMSKEETNAFIQNITDEIHLLHANAVKQPFVQ